MIFSTGLVRRTQVAVSSHGFLLTEEIVIVQEDLVACYDAMNIVVRIYFALWQKLLTTIQTIRPLNRCEQFWYPSCRNLLHAQIITHYLINCCCWNSQFVSYATPEICRSRIPIHSTASMFSSMVIVDGRPVQGKSLKSHSRSFNSATHLTTVW